MTPKEREVMNILSEECAEVIQAISKCHRFGIDNMKPGQGKTNREHLEEEVGDLLAMIDILTGDETLSRSMIHQAAERKIDKLKQWSTVYATAMDSK